MDKHEPSMFEEAQWATIFNSYTAPNCAYLNKAQCSQLIQDIYTGRRN